MRRRPRAALLAAAVAAASAGLVPPTALAAAAAPAAVVPPAQATAVAGVGQLLATADGEVLALGEAPTYGSLEGLALNAPVLDLALLPRTAGQGVGPDLGYWMLGADGGVFAFGAAGFFGSTGGLQLNADVVALLPTPSGQGYWLVAEDGGIFSFGDAEFYGSLGDVPLNAPVVSGFASPTGEGYTMIAADGGVFTFGDAGFFGSLGGTPLNEPVIDAVGTGSGDGYWLLGLDGGVFSFGDAQFYGSTGGLQLNAPVVSISRVSGGLGYSTAALDGGVFTFGRAPFFGSGVGADLSAPVVALATTTTPALSLTVLHNNDGESQLSEAADGGGAAPFATLVDQLRATAASDPFTAGAASAGDVLISSGDNFLAGANFSASQAQADDERWYEALLVDAIGYDAITVGNHDLDFGPEGLARYIRDSTDADDPQENVFVTSNLDFSAEPELAALVEQGRLAPSTVVDVDGQAVGIVGATTDTLRRISSPRDIVINEVAPAVQAAVDDLTAEGVDIIVVSSHLQGIASERALAAELTDVDAIIAGGGDELLVDDGDPLLTTEEAVRAQRAGSYPVIEEDATGASVPIVTTPGNFRYVGQLQLAFDEAGQLLDVAEASRLVPVTPDVAPRADVQADVIVPVEAFVAALAANVLGTTEVELDGRNAGGYPVRVRESNLGNLAADSLLFAAQQRAADFALPVPTVSLQNGGGIRLAARTLGGENGPTITERDTFDVYPFANFVSIVPDVTPAELKELLEHSVSASPTANGLFGQWGGIRFTYDVQGVAQVTNPDTNLVTTPGTRIVSAELADGTDIVAGGAALPGAPAIALATIDFTARGGDNYPFAGKAGDFASVGIGYQGGLADYLTSEATAVQPVSGGSGLTGLDGVVTAARYPLRSGDSTATGPLIRITCSDTVPATAPACPTGAVDGA